MRRIILLIFTLLFYISCHKEYQPRNIKKVTVQEFKMDSTSIRAIQVIDAETIYFGGSKGIIGFTKGGGKSWSKESIKYKDSITPHFRSLAYNGKNCFALSIGNPALLYKISRDKKEIVYTEKHKKVFYDSMYFFDDNIHGIAVGDPTENCPSIILTSDGGNSWNKSSCKKYQNLKKVKLFLPQVIPT